MGPLHTKQRMLSLDNENHMHPKFVPPTLQTMFRTHCLAEWRDKSICPHRTRFFRQYQVARGYTVSTYVG